MLASELEAKSHLADRIQSRELLYSNYFASIPVLLSHDRFQPGSFRFADYLPPSRLDLERVNGGLSIEKNLFVDLELFCYDEYQ